MCAVGACDDGNNVDAEAVTRILEQATDDPGAATDLLTDRATGSLAADAEKAGMPAQDVVAWLLADHGLPDDTTDAAGQLLTTAAAPTTRPTEDVVAADMVCSPTVTPALRQAVAQMLVERVGELMSSATTNRPWSPDDLARLLSELGGDTELRETIGTAITDRAHQRISAGKLADAAVEAKVVRPTGWLIGALDAGAAEHLDDAEAATLFADRQLALETLAEQSMLDAGRSEQAARAMAASDRWPLRRGTRGSGLKSTCSGIAHVTR